VNRRGSGFHALVYLLDLTAIYLAIHQGIDSMLEGSRLSLLSERESVSTSTAGVHGPGSVASLPPPPDMGYSARNAQPRALFQHPGYA
jgi:hypothetical protein